MIARFLFVVAIVVAVGLSSASGQVIGDYGSAGAGPSPWSAAASWVVCVSNGTFAGASAAVSAPGGADNVWIQTGNTITVDVAISGITGTITDAGTLTIGGGSLAFTTGTYNHKSNSGTIPVATWSTGSTCEITGITSATSLTNGTSQSFYNYVYNCPSQSSSFGAGLGGATINGSMTILSTGTGRLQCFGSTAGTLTILGNLIVSGSASATMNGTSSGGSTDTLYLHGNLDVNTTGNFSISRGSQAGTGLSIWNLMGDSVNIAAGAMSNSTTTGFGANPGGRFRFVKGGTQYLSFSATTLGTNAAHMEIANGSTVQLISAVNLSAGSNNNIILTNGTIVTSSTNVLTLAPNDSIFSASGSGYIQGPLTLTSTASTTPPALTFPIGKGSAYRPVTLTVQHDAATATQYKIEVFNAAPTGRTLPGTLDKVSTVRYYTVTKGTGANVTTASILLNYGADDNVIDASNLRIAKDDGAGNWVDLGGTGSAPTTGTIGSTAAFTTFGDFVLANNTGGGNVLPVELTSFTGSANGRTVELVWKTATEINNSGFEVQKNSNGSWSKVGFVGGAGTSNTPHAYSFSDLNSAVSKYSYRLKQIDRGGKFTYSNAVEVTTTLSAEDFKLSQNYPNPFNPSTKLSFAAKNAERTTVKVYNVVGQEVATLFNEVAQPNQVYSMTFDARNLQSGTYFYVLHSASRNEVKKMMLMK